MTLLDPDRLRDIRTFDDVLAYLADDLDWPIAADDLEDATFPFTPEELGVPAERVPRLTSLRQLRPLTAAQPWGIFFLEFSGPRLPLTPLRRLLQTLVTKKRATGDGTRRTWDLDDLLFVITTDTGDTVELHFLAFFDTGSPTVEVRSLPWRPRQSPEQHLRRLATELLPHLEWPDQPADTDRWRSAWRQAFKLRHGEAIQSAARLAERMAATAAHLRQQIDDALDDEAGDGPFTDLLTDVRTMLVAGLDHDRFADMCAQTLVYGVLSSRITDPIGFGASPTLSAVPLSNTFLAAFFEQVYDQTTDLDVSTSGLEQLVADLRESNVEAILDQFGSTAKGGDPVIHFYEAFLTAYDRKMRADSGAFYTPQPVVTFMTRAVNDLLRSRFGLPLGVADPQPWSEVADRLGIAVPAGVDPESPFLSMVDPATGTGTFLIEWIRRAEATFRAAHPTGDWPGHLRRHVLPAMHAFELMLGPYAIAHLKTALELHNEDLAGTDVQILLADTLDHPAGHPAFEEMSDPVALEGQLAADIKRDTRFTVVIGNPPYDREQKGTEDGGKRKGGVVRYGVPGISPLLKAVTEPMRAAGQGKHIKNLYNDYVYFWRWATWQATQLPDGPGVVAFITANSYLDGISMAGLRHHLRTVFDELWIIDLGGEGRGAITEENVFDIRTAVAIAFGIRHLSRPPKDCTIHYTRIHGTRQHKFATLNEASLASLPFTDVPGTGLDPLTPRSGTPYASWTPITDVFPWIHSGCQFKRTWPIGESQSLVERRWRELLDLPPRSRAIGLKETRDRSANGSYAPLQDGEGRLRPIVRLRAGDSPEGIERYGYRSFDRQWAIADNRIADFPRPPLWRVRGRHQLFLTTLTSTKLGRGPALTVTPYVPDLDHFRGSYGAKNVMPLYRDRHGKLPNVTDGLLEVLEEELGTPVTVDDLVAYVHGLLGTAAFADQFTDELTEAAGPVHIPFTSDVGLFEDVVVLGRDLLWWHTWGERFAPEGASQLPEGVAEELTPVTGYPQRFNYSPGTQQLSVGTGAFGPITREAWEFEVSGLRVLQSWLGYRMAKRKGRKSSPLDDIRPVRWTFSDELITLIAILQHTIDMTSRAEEVIKSIVDGPFIDPRLLPAPKKTQLRAPSL